jgi:hypothetical protein
MVALHEAVMEGAEDVMVILSIVCFVRMMDVNRRSA